MTLEDRILKNIKKDGECWKWMGSRDFNGHALITYNYKKMSAHRILFEWHGNTLDKKTLLKNICGTKNCVNPIHWKIYLARGNIEKNTTGASMPNSG